MILFAQPGRKGFFSFDGPLKEKGRRTVNVLKCPSSPCGSTPNNVNYYCLLFDSRFIDSVRRTRVDEAL
jgi:hypothetical protein